MLLCLVCLDWPGLWLSLFARGYFKVQPRLVQSRVIGSLPATIKVSSSTHAAHHTDWVRPNKKVLGRKGDLAHMPYDLPRAGLTLPETGDSDCRRIHTTETETMRAKRSCLILRPQEKVRMKEEEGNEWERRVGVGKRRRGGALQCEIISPRRR